jgi:tetratricopeptide (TPR) repeat protein
MFYKEPEFGWFNYDLRVTAYALLGLGLVMIGRERYQDATNYLRNSLASSQELGDQGMLVWITEAIGSIQYHIGQVETAVRLYASAAALRSELKFPIPQSNKAEYSSMIEALRSTLSPEQFDTLWHAGGRVPAIIAVNDVL